MFLVTMALLSNEESVHLGIRPNTNVFFKDLRRNDKVLISSLVKLLGNLQTIFDIGQGYLALSHVLKKTCNLGK